MPGVIVVNTVRKPSWAMWVQTASQGVALVTASDAVPLRVCGNSPVKACQRVSKMKQNITKKKIIFLGYKPSDGSPKATRKEHGGDLSKASFLKLFSKSFRPGKPPCPILDSAKNIRYAAHSIRFVKKFRALWPAAGPGGKVRRKYEKVQMGGALVYRIFCYVCWQAAAVKRPKKKTSKRRSPSGASTGSTQKSMRDTRARPFIWTSLRWKSGIS